MCKLNGFDWLCGISTSRAARGFFLLWLCGLGTVGAAGNVHELPGLSISGWRVALPEAGTTFAMPVSALVYEPLLDVQVRNFAEGQADVTLRGGIFENTGFAIGAATLFDPQTGHYFAEIPIPSSMLGAPEVLTGSANALVGFNSAVGTVRYRWQPVRKGIHLEAGFGDHGLNRQEALVAENFALGSNGHRLGVEVSGARSESDGALAFGDHQFQRVAARLQWLTPHSQSDVFIGTQEKFFGWPYLYAPKSLHQALTAFGASGTGAETEDLQTTLLLLNHRRSHSHGFWEMTAYYRKNRDDYEFDRFAPGLFNPYEHETEVFSGALQGEYAFGTSRVRFGGQWLADAIDSTSLTWVPPTTLPPGQSLEDFSPFQSRSYFQAAIDFGRSRGFADGNLSWLIGAQFAGSNRDEEALAPYARIAYETESWILFADAAGNSQLPGYTALASNPNSGLFRGNLFLGREASRQAEIGTTWRQGTGAETFLETSLVAYFRSDEDLVDWVFSANTPTARSAQPVDTDTAGLEALAHWRSPRFEALASYAFVDKSFAFADPAIDASFYALNYAEHRLTMALIWKPLEGVQLRMDNEWRQQRENFLREGDDQAFLSTFALSWTPAFLEKLTLSATVQNVWDTAFEEVPGVPGSPRTWLVGIRYLWK
jgi:vitamin B12 transporter